MKFTLRDRQSLVIGDERIVNDSGRTIALVVPCTDKHCRVDKRRYPRPEKEIGEVESKPD